MAKCIEFHVKMNHKLEDRCHQKEDIRRLNFEAYFVRIQDHTEVACTDIDRIRRCRPVNQ